MCGACFLFWFAYAAWHPTSDTRGTNKAVVCDKSRRYSITESDDRGMREVCRVAGDRK